MLKKENLILLIVFITLLTAGCEAEVGRKVKKTNIYYDLAGLLGHQLYLLDSLGPNVEKLTTINGVQEVREVQLDSAGWARELSIFYEADINDPVLKDAYEVETITEDSLKTVIYRSLDKKVKTHLLKIHYQENEDHPIYITAIVKENNILYTSQRTLKLNFSSIQRTPVLSSYFIDEKQKIILKDTNYYHVEGKNVF